VVTQPPCICDDGPWRADASTLRYRMPSARLTFLGAARTVTGSCYHLALGDASLLVDCGTFQGDRDADELNHQAPQVDVRNALGTVFTHGHLDHVGRLPAWVKHGFRGNVWGHAATLDIAKVILEDSAKIANHAPGQPLYGDQEVAQIVDSMRPMHGYGTPMQIGPFAVTLFDAGHILGSSSVRVAWQQNGADRAILFSGDLGVAGAPLIRDPNTAWHAERDRVDYVVTESTYGDRLHMPRADVRNHLRTIVERALQDGGKVIIPAFSIGRTQEIVYELHQMVAAGLLRDIPIIVDGPLGLSATKIYAKHTECYDAEAMAMVQRGVEPLEFDSLYSARDANASRRAVNAEGPAIIIAGSGMCQGGRIRHHLLRHLPDPRADVLLVGYQSGRTLGRALQEGRTTVFIDNQQVLVRARITTISGLSAHADRDGLANWFEKIPRAAGARTFVTHGEAAQSDTYAKLLTDRFHTPAHAPAMFESVEL
jgi:metallo-beta-lactamase family protein